MTSPQFLRQGIFVRCDPFAPGIHLETCGEKTFLLLDREPRNGIFRPNTVGAMALGPIKKAMCDQFSASDPAWLRKLRPWFGHSAHFHVRLHCPVGSKDCESQKPFPAGNGCGAELASWLNKPAMVSSKPVANPMPDLPARCDLLLSNKKP